MLRALGSHGRLSKEVVEEGPGRSRDAGTPTKAVRKEEAVGPVILFLGVIAHSTGPPLA